MGRYIQKLKNPKTNSYLELKNFILSRQFSWYWYDQSTDLTVHESSLYENISFYSHVFVTRPENAEEKIPKSNSNYTEIVGKVLFDILQFNDIKIRTFLRINANCVHPSKRVLSSVPHIDHIYEHKNLIVYLTDAGGNTIVWDEHHIPNEDDVILFDSTKEHYLQTPKDKRRIILIATFI